MCKFLALKILKSPFCRPDLTRLPDIPYSDTLRPLLTKIADFGDQIRRFWSPNPPNLVGRSLSLTRWLLIVLIRFGRFKKNEYLCSAFSEHSRIIQKYDIRYDSKRDPRLIQEVFRVEAACHRALSTYGHQGRPHADVHQRRHEPVERYYPRHP